MPLTAGSAFNSSISASRSSREVSAGRLWRKLSMPTSAEALCLEFTYTAEAGSSPTSTVASPGARPCSATNWPTSSATSARTRAATALPSITRARGISSSEHHRGVAVANHAVLTVPLHRTRQRGALHVRAALLELGNRLAVRHADHVLLDDRAGVELLGDVVGGGPDQL